MKSNLATRFSTASDFWCFDSSRKESTERRVIVEAPNFAELPNFILSKLTQSEHQNIKALVHLVYLCVEIGRENASQIFGLYFSVQRIGRLHFNLEFDRIRSLLHVVTCR